MHYRRQKLIYLASPYSHKNPEIERLREFYVTKLAAELTKKYGYAMFLPITQSCQMVRHEQSLGGLFDSWKDIDLFMISKKCDELWVYKLPGWRESVGVTAEIKCARENDKTILYIEANDEIIKKFNSLLS